MGVEDYPLLQGQYLSWAEIQPVLAIAGGLDVKTKDFAAIDFNDSLTPSKVRGVGPVIRGRTVGLYDADGTMSMYHASAVSFRGQLLKAAQANGHNRIALVAFDLIINWSPLDGIGSVYTTKLVGARLQERSQKNASSSADANVSEMPLSIVRVEEIDPTGNIIVLA